MAAIDQVDCSKRFVTRRSQQPFVVVEIGEALPNEQRFGWNGTRLLRKVRSFIFHGTNRVMKVLWLAAVSWSSFKEASLQINDEPRARQP